MKSMLLVSLLLCIFLSSTIEAAVSRLEVNFSRTVGTTKKEFYAVTDNSLNPALGAGPQYMRYMAEYVIFLLFFLYLFFVNISIFTLFFILLFYFFFLHIHLYYFFFLHYSYTLISITTTIHYPNSHKHSYIISISPAHNTQLHIFT